MAHAGVGEEVIVSYVKGVRIGPPLSAEEIVDWKKAGIADAVIRAAVEAK